MDGYWLGIAKIRGVGEGQGGRPHVGRGCIDPSDCGKAVDRDA